MSEHLADELLRALAALHLSQSRWLADLGEACQGDPAFAASFRRGQEELTMVKLQLHRAENRLLHYLLVPHHQRPWRECGLPAGDHRALAAQWTQRLAGWFGDLRLDGSYRRLTSVLALDEEAATADIVTDLAAVAGTAESTMPALARLGRGVDPAALEDLAFYHVLSPWKQHGGSALIDCLRWLNDMLG
ncbi:MAG: hypothetical protein H0W83_16620, partial [Planctomycetes bacterium]|nr:hypothetical protein [Planctomycetota bacterium]